jgi:selenophosphate synthase
MELAAAGVETDGAAHNRRFVAPALTVAAGVAADLVTLAHDPQTSGGLLAAFPGEQLASVESALSDAGVEHWLVGRVEEGSGVRLA